MPFVKLDCAINESTIWVQPHDVLRVWIALLIKADANGDVHTTAPAFALGCMVTLERMREILDIFQSSDPDSRTSDHDGRRIEKIEGGFHILNYEKYRSHDYGAKDRMRALREQRKLDKAPSYPGDGDSCPMCHTQFKRPFNLHVVLDHDHMARKYRAYICQGCNKIVGQVENNKDVCDAAKAGLAEGYLKRFGSSILGYVPERSRTFPNVPETLHKAEAEAEAEKKKAKSSIQALGDINSVAPPIAIAAPERGEPTAKRRARQFPEDFMLTVERREYALKNYVMNPEREFEKFHNHHAARGSTMKDWDAAWRTWVLKARDFTRRAGGQTVMDRVEQAAARRDAEDAALIPFGRVTHA